VGDAVLKFLYPAKCCLCEGIGRPDVCEECLAECAESESSPDLRSGPVSLVDAVFPYEGRPAQAVRRLKYDRATGLWKWMSSRLRDRFESQDLGARYDLVVPVPLAKGRLGERGFNQSELLASGLTDVRTDLLKRIRETPPQVNLDVTTRRANLAAAFSCTEEVKGRSVLLVDDVYTTGATAEACALCLASAGALTVGVLTFCKVKEPVGP
ncbi:MAG: ComF family protein, partial [Armatimonadota bacterium]